MRKYVIAAFAAVVALVYSHSVVAQPSGQLTFSGPAAPLLPSTSFVPNSFQQLGSGWNFFDPSGTFIVGITHLPGETATILVAQVSVGAIVWAATSPLVVAGVVITGNTVSFTDVTLPRANPPADNDLTIDGSLTRPVGTATEARSWSRVKLLFER